MTQLTRFDPFQELARFDPFAERGGLFGMPALRWPATPEPAIKVEVTEDETAFKVKADLPGVKKEDIAVEVEGDQVSISAEIRREKEEKEGEKVVHTERFYGRQARRFTLGQDIDRKAVTAKYDNGVLELTLPKNGSAGAKRVAIS